MLSYYLLHRIILAHLLVFSPLFISFALTLPASSSAADFESEEYKQDFLFLLEEAYTQEQDEWQFGLAYQQVNYQSTSMQAHLSDVFWELGLEYGFTNHFQIELSLPYQQSSWYQNGVKINTSALANPELDLIYQILEEEGAIPAVSLGLGGVIPVSSAKEPIRSDEFRSEFFISTSKYFHGLGFTHANLAYSAFNEGGDAEFSYGVAFVRPLSENYAAIIEYLAERSVDTSEDNEELAQFSIGFSYQNEHGLSAGVAYIEGNNKQALENAIALKLQYEF